MSFAAKICLVTGANKGIGLELVRQLSASGASVYAACRQTSPELNAVKLNGGVVVEDIDVSVDDCVPKLREAFGRFSFDIIINNAGLGVFKDEALAELDIDKVTEQFQVNAVGPLRVTKALECTLKQGSKIIIITSRMGSIEDNTSGGYYGYRMSKTAVNMACKSLSIDLKHRGVVVQALHPGMVTTDMTAGFSGGISTRESVAGLLARVEEASMATSGKFYHMNGQELPW